MLTTHHTGCMIVPPLCLKTYMDVRPATGWLAMACRAKEFFFAIYQLNFEVDTPTVYITVLNKSDIGI